MALKNLFGRGIGFGGPEWIPTHGYSIGAAVVNTLTIASGLVRRAPRFCMENVEPSFLLANRAPRFPLDRVEVDDA